MLKVFSYHDPKVGFGQDLLVKKHLFHVFQLFPIVCLTSEENLICLKKMIFDKNVLTKTHFWVMIFLIFLRKKNAPIMNDHDDLISICMKDNVSTHVFVLQTASYQFEVFVVRTALYQFEVFVL